MKRIKVALTCIMISIVYPVMLISCNNAEIIPTPTSTSIPTQAPTLTPPPTSTPTSIPTSTPTLAPTPTATPIPTLPPSSASLTQTQLHLKEGDIIHIRMVTEQEISSTIEGLQQDLIQKVGYGYTYTVTSVDAEGNFSIDIVYDWILLEQESDLGKFQFDSSDPPEEIPLEAEGYNALLGKSFSMKMTHRGEILEIEGLDEMYSEMIDDLGITDEAEREQMEQLLQDQFGEEALKEQMGNIVMDYPEGPIQVGETWTQRVESTVMVPLIFDTTYSIRSFENGIATIDARSIITPDPDAEMLDLGYAKIGYNLSGEQEGVTILDVETGLIISGTMTQTLTGEMTISMEDEEMTVPISLLGETTIEMGMEE
jgi:hypothetical protein